MESGMLAAELASAPGAALGDVGARYAATMTDAVRVEIPDVRDRPAVDAVSVGGRSRGQAREPQRVAARSADRHPDRARAAHAGVLGALAVETITHG